MKYNKGDIFKVNSRQSPIWIYSDYYVFDGKMFVDIFFTESGIKYSLTRFSISQIEDWDLKLKKVFSGYYESNKIDNKYFQFYKDEDKVYIPSSIFLLKKDVVIDKNLMLKYLAKQLSLHANTRDYMNKSMSILKSLIKNIDNTCEKVLDNDFHIPWIGEDNNYEI